MSAKHTPGPWSVSPRTNNMIDVYHHVSKPGAITMNLCRVQARPSWIEEAQANARLIAAAPDLLEALDTALPVMRSYFEALGPCDHGVGICNCDMKTAITQVEAAIAKARGQS